MYFCSVMYKLNLPEFDCKIKKEDGKVWIFDVIRKKFIVLTPEEWVRQHFISYLITELQYPKSLIKVEGGLTYNQLKKRSDIVVFNREGKPWMIIECKSPELKVSALTLQQASVYNVSLKAKYLTVTNGMVHLCSSINWLEGKTSSLPSLPIFDE
jgi:hypothetical protein